MLKKKSLKKWKLYVITDPVAVGRRTVTAVVRQALEGGASVVQLRDKHATDAQLTRLAQRLLKLTRPLGIPLIINDRPGVALRSGADGVHLGQEDASLKEARALLGKHAIIGRSTHSASQALAAQQEGFDYIGVGPVFKTPTKPSYGPVGLALVRFAAKNIQIPFVAIGGIDVNNIGKVKKAGADTCAVVRAVMGSPDPKKATVSLLKKMRRP